MDIYNYENSENSTDLIGTQAGTNARRASSALTMYWSSDLALGQMQSIRCRRHLQMAISNGFDNLHPISLAHAHGNAREPCHDAPPHMRNCLELAV